MKAAPTACLRRPRLSRLMAALLAPLAGTAAALPQGMTVGAGTVNASQPDGATLNLNQTTPRAVLDWRSFNIAAGEKVRFDQPGATSVVLNRVAPGNPSAIYGALSANGQVFLVNPSGVLFAPGAQVDVGSLVATTLAISNGDFLAGRYRFEAGPGAGSVVNQGTITAQPGGFVLLAAPQVANHGSITADGGAIGLAAGGRVAIQTSSQGLVKFAVDAAAVDAAVANSGVLQADGGTVALQARALTHTLSTVVNQTGVIRARSAVESEGRVLLSGGPQGVVVAGGTIAATGTEPGRKGGTIEVFGDKVLVPAGARLDASGQAGGGTLLVGGDWQGQTSGAANASRVYVADGASLRADALQQGDGGKVVVWADGDTRFHGSISARGGAAGGDGGEVEVSGKKQLDFRGSIDVAAPRGRGGKVLFDPENIVLDNVGDPAPPDQADGTPDVAFGDPPNPGTTTLNIADVTGFSELFLQASNDITINSDLVMGFGNSVVLEADNNITALGTIRTSGGGNIVLTADADFNNVGTLDFRAGLSSGGGCICISAADVVGAGTVSTQGGADMDGGHLTINAGTSVSLAGNIITDGGAASTDQAGRHAGQVIISSLGSIAIADVSANGSQGNGTGQGGGNGGSIALIADGALSAGALSASGRGGSDAAATTGVAGNVAVVNFGSTSSSIALGSVTATGDSAQASGASTGNIEIVNLAVGESITTGSLTTRGSHDLSGGHVIVQADGGDVTVSGSITTTGGARTGDGKGNSAGDITIAGANLQVTGSIAASGAGGVGTDQAGGDAGFVTLNGSGTVTTGHIAASAGFSTGAGPTGAAGAVEVHGTAITLANVTTAGPARTSGGSILIEGSGGISATSLSSAGGSSTAGAAGSGGDITVTNTGTGAISIGSVNARAGGAVNSDVGASGATVEVVNSAVGEAITIGSVLLGGLDNSNGGSLVLDAKGAVTVSSAISTAGGNIHFSGDAAGRDAGTVTLKGTDILVSGSVLAGGGSGRGTDRAGGAAGAVTLAGSGTVTVSGISASGGQASGTGVPGNGANVEVTGSNLSLGNVFAQGGGNGGRGGDITVNATGTVTATSLSSAGGSGSVGGDGGSILVAARGAISAVAVNSSGGNGSATGRGGSAGDITVRNDSATTGAISLGSVSARGGSANGGNFLGARGGTVRVTNSAAGATLDIGSVSLSGLTNAHGGSIVLSALGNVTLAGGGINTSAGALDASADADGRDAGTINISGADIQVVGGMAATGGAARGTDRNGTSGGAITMTATGRLSVSGGGGTSTASGSGTGTGSSGTGGAIDLSAAIISVNSLSASAAGGGDGGTVRVNSSGSVNITTVSSNGGSPASGAGGRGGNITIAAGSTLTAAGGISSNGGVGNTGPGGDGGNILLTANGGIFVPGAISSAGGNSNSDVAGDGGLITVANNSSSTGAILISALNARAGTSFALAGARGGTVDVTNDAAGATLDVGTVSLSGLNNAHGGSIALRAQGAVTVGSGLDVSGGATIGSNVEGRDAGTITVSGTDRTIAGAVRAVGSNGISGGNGGAGGAIELTGSGFLTTNGNSISSSGGNGTLGRAAGLVTLGGSTISTGNVSANGGSGGTAADAGAITVNGNGAITIAGISANGGSSSSVGVAGGNGGAISVRNASTTTGAIAVGALSSRSGSANAGVGATSGSVTVINDAAGAALDTGAVSANGQNHGHGGNVTLRAQGAVTVTGDANASAGAQSTGDADGRNAGSIVLSGTDLRVTGNVSAVGGSAFGTNRSGGSAGSITLTGSGTVQAGNLASNGGAGTAGMDGGAGAAVAVDGTAVTLGTITTSGASNRDAGTVTVAASGNLATGVLTASGGSVAGSGSGGQGGAVDLAGADVTVGAITASGSGTGSGGEVRIAATGSVTGAGITSTGGSFASGAGSGGAVTVTGVGTISPGAITTTGGSAGAGAAGGSGGDITVTNNSTTTGAVTVGAISARAGTATGSHVGARGGVVQVTNHAAGAALSVGAVALAGVNNAHGGSIALRAQGAVTVAGGIDVSGGLLDAAADAEGRNGGFVTITGTDRILTGGGTILASGQAGRGTDRSGGTAGPVTLTGTGTLTVGSVTAVGGSATGTGTGGAGGTIDLSGSDIAIAGAVSASGVGNAADSGDIRIAATGSLAVTNAVAIGGGGLAGGDGGDITISSHGAFSTGVVLATGGNSSGAAAGGNGGNITISNESATAGAMSIATLGARGGSAVGSNVGARGGVVRVTNKAAGEALAIGSVQVSGPTNAHGGSVDLRALGALTITGDVNTSGGTLAAGADATGRDAGSLRLEGSEVRLNNGFGGFTNAIASGGAGLGTDRAGGAAANLTIVSGGAIVAADIRANSGGATGAGAGGAAAVVDVSGGDITANSISASAGTQGAGGTVRVAATGNLSAGSIGATGGAGNAGQDTPNGGTVTVTAGGSVTLIGSVSTFANNGSAGGNGGDGGDISITANGAININGLSATGGNSSGAARGGHGGNITVTNNSTTTGAISTGAISARGGSAAAGQPGARGGLVQVTNNAAGAALNVGTLTLGNTNYAHGASIALRSQGALVVASDIITTGGNMPDAADDAVGLDAGSVTLSGTSVEVADGGGFARQIVTNGGSGRGADRAGGAAGDVTITSTGTVRTGNITAMAGTPTGTAPAGAGATLDVTGGDVTLGTVFLAGPTGGDGGTIRIAASGNLVATSLSSGAGAALANTAGHDGGAITATAGGSISVGGINANGSNGNGSGQAGGAGGSINLQAGAGIGALNVTSNGGGASVGAGGAAGSVRIGNSGSGNIQAGSVTAIAGSGGTGGTGGAAGSVEIVNAAAGGHVQTASLDVRGATDADGGTLLLSSQGNVTVSGDINAGGGARTAAGAGTRGGSVTVAGVDRSLVAVRAAGGNASGTNQAGGDGGQISITGAGTLSATFISASVGAPTGSGTGGAGGAVSLSGSDLAWTDVAANASSTGSASMVRITAANALDMQGVNATSGNVVIDAGGPVTQAGALRAGSVALQGTGASYTLRHASNAVNTLAANTGSIDFAQAGALTVGTVDGTAGITASGAVKLETTNAASNLTIAAPIASSATGDAVVLKAGSAGVVSAIGSGGQVLNTFGAGGIATPNGRFLAYSGSPTLTTEGVTGYAKRYASDASYVPAGSDSYFLYRIAPTLVVSADNLSRSYGDANPVLTGNVTGLIDGDTAGSVGVSYATTAVAGTRVADGPVPITVNVTNLENYALVLNGGQLTIDPRALTVAATGQDKVYDGGTAAVVTLSDNRVAGDSLVLSHVDANFANKNAGTGKTITVNGISVSGADISNYTFNTTATTTADITPRALAVTATGQDKVYDGGTGATVNYADDRLGGDVFTVTGSAAFANKNVGTGKAIGVTGIALAGADAGNYTANTTATTAADITPKALTVTATGQDKVYDGNVNATVAYGDDRVAGDVLSFAGTASFGDKNVGTAKAVGVTGITLGGADAGNYTFNTTASTSADITPRALVVSAAAQDKVYDGNRAATVSLGDDRVVGDTLVLTHGGGQFADKNAGTAKAVTVAGIGVGGADAGNYTFNTSAVTDADITPKALTVTATGQNKVYDGNANATVTYGDDRVAGDALAIAGTASFGNKNVGTGKAVGVAGISVTGTDAGNYTFNTTATTAADITPKALTVTASGQDKVYDGNVNATVIYGDDRVAGDVLAFTGTATFGNKNVGTAKAVGVSGINVTGADAGNYTFNTTTATAADITPRALAVTAAGQDKVYDGNVNATVIYGDDRVAGDVLAIAGTATFGNKNVGNGKAVGVTGINVTGTDAGNYSFNTTATTAAAITPRALTVTAAGQDKVYDGNVNATVTYGDDRVAGDALTFSGTATFGDKNAGNGKAVGVAGIAVGGADAGNYTYNTTATTAANITPRALAITATGQDKVYDGNVNATVTYGDNRVAGDALAFTGTATFGDKNVGNGKAVAVTGINVTGTDAGNYSFNTTATTAADITPRALAITATGQDKVYDGNVNAAVTYGDDRVAGDVLAFTGTATFGDKNVGNGKAVGVTGINVTGTDAGNYSFNTTATTTADITPRALTITATGQDKVYDGNVNATVSYGDNRVAGDVLTFSGTATFGDKNVGNGKAVGVAGIALGGADAGNYSYNSTATTAANITPRALTVTAAGQDKVYDGNVNATVTYGDNRVAGDLLALTGTATFGDKNVGNGKVVGVSGISVTGADAGNYSFNTTATTTADITPRALTVTATGQDKVYDGNVNATVSYGDNRVAGDLLTFSGTATFGDKNVGNGKAVGVAGIALGGADAGNYSHNSTATTAANITPRALTVTAAGHDKVYDGNVNATVTYGDNRVAGDVLALAGTATFGDKNVGNGKAVGVSGIAVTGADAGNYTYNGTATTTADITPRALTVTAAGQDKVYDGNVNATVVYGDDRVAGDVLAFSGTATFGDKNVEAGKAVGVSGIGVTGADAGNYTFNTTATTAADITPRALSVTATGQNKVYDGNVNATVLYGDDRVAGDFLAIAGNASFGDKNVGAGKAVGVSGISVTGTDAGNYTFNTTATTTADITPRALSVTAAGQDKVYDGNVNAAVTYGDDRVAGDVLAITGTARFGDKNAGAGKAVSVNGIAVTGTDAGNYTFNGTAATTANITPRALTVTATGQNKVYDGSTAATVGYGDDRVAGDALSFSGTASFADKHVGTAKPVAVGGIALGGADAGNYTYNTTATTAANITPRALTVTATGHDRVYDGTAAATVSLGDNRVAGDALALAYGAASFADKNAGADKAISVGGITISGADAANYSFNTTAGTAADILRATISGVTGITAGSRVADGTTRASLDTSGAAFVGRIAGDQLGVATATGQFDTPAPGTDKVVTISGISLGGADAGNYLLADPGAVTRASIFPGAGLAGSSEAARVVLSQQRDNLYRWFDPAGGPLTLEELKERILRARNQSRANGR